LCTTGLGFYRDGRDSVAWHGDTSGRRVPTTIVAIVSLGNPRPFLLRPCGPGGLTLRHEVGHGDLLVMGGTLPAGGPDRNWAAKRSAITGGQGPPEAARLTLRFEPAEDWVPPEPWRREIEIDLRELRLAD